MEGPIVQQAVEGGRRRSFMAPGRHRLSLGEELQEYLDQYAVRTGRAVVHLISRCSELSPVRALLPHQVKGADGLSAVEQATARKLGNGLKSLPDEVLLEIFTWVVALRQPSLAALEISHVCGRFRRLAIASRSLWSEIHPASHNYRMVALYAGRNRSLGLNVTLSNRQFCPNKVSHIKFLKTVVHAQRRWRSLTIEVENRSVEELLNSLNGMRGNTPLPGLKHLCIKAARFYSQPFSEEEKSQLSSLYSSLQADNLVSIATTDLVPYPLPPNLSELSIYVHSRTNLSDTPHSSLDRNRSIKGLNVVFYFPENDNNQVVSNNPTSFDEVEVLHVQTPHVKKRSHVGAQIFFTHIHLPKLRTLVIDYDFKVRYEAKSKDMDLSNLENYYLQDPLFKNGLNCLVLNLYKSCQANVEHQLHIPFHKIPFVHELRIETPHPFATLRPSMEGKSVPAFRRVVFQECENLTSEWLSEFVAYLRRDDAAWKALDKIIINRCPLITTDSVAGLLPDGKLSF
ncbi:hypothetical protein SCHPADRAFT_934971 [Schizopora paradoxa]|uniref:F-box domain-containing protein n=1 Tax=Schizopora paradoxa TaxID=27342 RepID=A0A0H2S6C0_9AGAM|nr:hypothetical protein SCHPADRAFT_934971 [Schizopora paradoxa]